MNSTWTTRWDIVEEMPANVVEAHPAAHHPEMRKLINQT